VWRSFAWNESGAYARWVDWTPDLAASYGIGDGTDCLRRGRPMGPTLVWANGNEVGYEPASIILRVNTGGVDYDEDITPWCQQWKDCCGFTIIGPGDKDIFNLDDEGNPFSGWCPFEGYEKASTLPAPLRDCNYLTLLHNTLRNDGTYKMELFYRGTIEDDKAVQYTSAKQASRAMPLLSEQVAHVPQFRKFVVGDDLAGTEDTRDDTAAITAYAGKLRDSGEDELGMGSLLIPYLTKTYRPLLGVTGTTQRTIDFDVDAGANINYPLIRGITWTFGHTAVTELKLDSNMLGVT